MAGNRVGTRHRALDRAADRGDARRTHLGRERRNREGQRFQPSPPGYGGFSRGCSPPSAGGEGPGALDIEALAAQAREHDGATVLAARVQVDDGKALLDVADRLKGKLNEAAIALGAANEGRAHLLVSVSPALVSRGVRAGEVVKAAAEVVGGGGGGRDTLAQAGGREPEKLDAALEKAEAVILSALES